MALADYIPKDIIDMYDIRDYKHAAVILSKEFPVEFGEICEALRRFRFTEDDLLVPGGNEGPMPKIISRVLRPMGWIEKQLTAQLVVESHTVSADSHKVDYLKGRIAFDMEWNSKDQTFDRDLYAFKTFFEYDKISLGVLLTRSTSLVPLFKHLGINKKFGASTTHMDKLIPRLDANRNGGCPVLVFGITPNLLIPS